MRLICGVKVDRQFVLAGEHVGVQEKLCDLSTADIIPELMIYKLHYIEQRHDKCM